MKENFNMEPMLEMYLFETNQFVDRLEQLSIDSEEENSFLENIDEVFRIMHTIKGNSMMMMFENIAGVAHKLEDLFDYLKTVEVTKDTQKQVLDFMFRTIDYYKMQLVEVTSTGKENPEKNSLVDDIIEYYESIKFVNQDDQVTASNLEVEDQKYYVSQAQTTGTQGESKYYHAAVIFVDDCMMEEVRAFSVVHNLKEFAEEIVSIPRNLIDNESARDEIVNNGLHIYFRSVSSYDDLNHYFESLSLVQSVEFIEIKNTIYKSVVENKNKDIDEVIIQTQAVEESLEIKLETEEPLVITENSEKKKENKKKELKKKSVNVQSYISVGVNKIDRLMDLIGELVISESMVINNPDLKNLDLINFHKAARQLRLVINEVQDVVMSVRMVPLKLTFQKLNRISRDMCKKTGKDVQLNIIGEETEVDKNVIEKISDPLMHIIRNSIDHGIEGQQERDDAGKPSYGTVTVEAKQLSGNVWITVKDDGKGINLESVLDKAEEKELLRKNRDDYSEQEIYNLLFEPGFSTKQEIDEFSGRGVGMDVVKQNITDLGGNVLVQSEEGIGSDFSIVLPLTLAIIDGMMLKVGANIFVLPITAIKESFNVKDKKVIVDPQGREMIVIRGVCYPIHKLNEKFEVDDSSADFDNGILVMIEHEHRTSVLLVDALLGEQQVVVKNLPKFIDKVDGVSGCALLGDGRISLILDPSELIKG